MERKPILVALAVALACVLARGANDPACADPSREGDPYAVCRHHELTVSEFNRCISAVYLDEMRKTDLVIDLEQALSGPGPDARASSQQCLQQNPCMYDPATGRHQECLSLAADEHCHHYGGPCSP